MNKHKKNITKKKFSFEGRLKNKHKLNTKKISNIF